MQKAAKKGSLNPDDTRLQGPQTFLQTIKDLIPVLIGGCEGILSNATLMAKLKEYNPELLLAETLSPCAQIMASKLDVPFVNFWLFGPVEPFATSIWRRSNRNAFAPNPIAYFPQKGTEIETQYMSFMQRLYNFATYLHFQWEDYINVRPITQAAFKRFGVDPDALRERRRMVMTLNIGDPAIEWLRPLPPDLKMIGPILPEPARPLPADLEEFMEGAGNNGVLLVAMGTIATLGLKERQAMAAAFAKLPARVLWRLSKSEVPNQNAITALNLGNNTKVATWLPQNDVLGHPRTRAFLSHCGVNGLYEAAYHGVPIAALPFFADQPENADKAVGRGFAVRVHHEDIGTERFPEALKRVLTDPSFKEAAERVSLKLRARPRTPTQEAADWVEHVLATGGEAYLRTPNQDLPFIVRYSLDIWAACLGAAAILVYAAFLLARLALNKFGAALVKCTAIANEGVLLTNGHQKAA
ncbi:UDP-glucuronosyltransferase 2A1 [Coccomyxa sp. Obi]|nr:UDP-glucuronosyltransferase 2A1 [Coccomyxa sp. Obi]